MYWKNPIQSWRRQKERYQWLGVTGKLLSWTRIEAPPQSFGAHSNYLVGIIDCGKRGRAVGQLVEVVDEKSLKVGQKFKGILRRIYEDGDDGVITYGVKFKPHALSPLKVRGG